MLRLEYAQFVIVSPSADTWEIVIDIANQRYYQRDLKRVGLWRYTKVLDLKWIRAYSYTIYSLHL